MQCIQLFRKRVQYLSRAFTFIRNVSYLNHMNDYKIREVLRPGTDAVGLNKKNTNTITVNFISSMATHLHVNALVLCYFLNCMTMFLCPVYLIHYKDTPCFIKSGVRVILLKDTSRPLSWYWVNILKRINTTKLFYILKTILVFITSLCFIPKGSSYSKKKNIL